MASGQPTTNLRLSPSHPGALLSSSGNSNPGGPSTDLTGIEALDFIKRDNGFIREMLEGELRVKNQVTNTVNALIVVGAFIAGVQAQIISSISARTDVTTQVVANGFAFVGLTLDIVGTFFGVIHARELQISIQKMPKRLRSLSDKNLRSVLGNLQQQIESDVDAVVEQAEHRLREELTEHRKFWTSHRFLSTAPTGESFHLHLRLLFPQHHPSIMLRLRKHFLPSHQDDVSSGLGIAPVLAMGAGIVCLLISVICFAAYSLPRFVWITCLTITVVSAYVSLMGLFSIDEEQYDIVVQELDMIRDSFEHNHFMDSVGFSLVVIASFLFRTLSHRRPLHAWNTLSETSSIPT